MLVQANEYEINQPNKRLDRFFESTTKCFTHPEVGSYTISYIKTSYIYDIYNLYIHVYYI